jgi:hypothetical protein
MRFAIVRLVRSPVAGDVRTARLVVADVPDRTTAAQLAQALTDAGRAGELSEGGIPFGNHEIITEGRAGWRKGVAGLADAPSVTWAMLTTPPVRSEGPRMTLRLTAAEHARFTMAAERVGDSLQSWAVAALVTAASEADAVAEARP